MHCSSLAFYLLVPTRIYLTAAERAALAESKQRYWAHPLVVETSCYFDTLKMFPVCLHYKFPKYFEQMPNFVWLLDYFGAFLPLHLDIRL